MSSTSKTEQPQFHPVHCDDASALPQDLSDRQAVGKRAGGSSSGRGGTSRTDKAALKGLQRLQHRLAPLGRAVIAASSGPREWRRCLALSEAAGYFTCPSRIRCRVRRRPQHRPWDRKWWRFAWYP